MDAVIGETVLFAAIIVEMLRLKNLHHAHDQKEVIDAVVTDMWVQTSYLRASGLNVFYTLNEYAANAGISNEAAFLEWTQFVNGHVHKDVVRALMRHVFVNVDIDALHPAPIGVA
jgi:hypothetical protein